MAAPITSSFFLGYFSSLILCLILFLCSNLETGFALQGKHTSSHDTYSTVQLSSLLPASICSHSSVPNNEATLKVVHKHGPCSGQDKIDHAEILRQDQSRVAAIRSRLSASASTAASSASDDAGTYKQDAVGGGGGATLPAKSGAVVGSGNYIVTVGLGTPKKDLSLIFDTGSDVTWTQCQPCAKSCYNQREAIFDPSTSASYANVSCTSSDCSYLKSATGITPGCSSATSTCIYGIQYGDQSFSVGYFARDTFTLTPSDVLTNVLFGCGQNNQGLFGSSAGLLGLGRNKISFVEQTALKYNRVFSYCLPSSSSSAGYLSFGPAAASKTAVKYTPLGTLSASASFYALQVVGISVGGKRISAPAALFQAAGTIIDSGTVITRLPPTAYAALRAEFKKRMAQYTAAPALSILDTCYDLSAYTTVSVPKVSFFFGGGAPVDLDATGILYAAKASQVCLAFAANGDDGDVAIFGNVQQRTLQVVYDIGGGRVGFGSGGCS